MRVGKEMAINAASTSRSFLAWVNVDTIDATSRVILNFGDATSGMTVELKAVSGIPTLHFTVYESSGAVLDTVNARLTAGVSACIAGTFDCTAGELRLYLNGNLVDAKTGGLNIGAGLAAFTGGSAIGGVNGDGRSYDGTAYGASNSNYDGRVQYAAVWHNEVLTAAQIGVAYRAGYQRYADTAHRLPGRHQLIFKATATSHKVALRALAGGSAEIESLFWRDTAWTPWSTPVKVAAGDNRVRALITESANVSRLYALTSVLDVPDVVESLSDVAIGSGGTRLSLTKEFRAVKAVSVTLQDDAGSAVTAKVIDRDATLGPLVECYDSSGSLTSGTIDATVQGY